MRCDFAVTLRFCKVTLCLAKSRYGIPLSFCTGFSVLGQGERTGSLPDGRTEVEISLSVLDRELKRERKSSIGAVANRAYREGGI